MPNEALFRLFGATDPVQLGKEADEHFQTFGLVTPLRIAHWFGQFSVESTNFTRFEENLNYSAERLCAVFPGRFPTTATAAPCAHNPQAFANKVYGGRMGNTAPGDGYRYRGRGPGLTGKDNYTAAAKSTGLPLITSPDVAADPSLFVLLACDYWDRRGCNAAADADDLSKVTRLVNGGLIGLADRHTALVRAKKALL